MEHRPQRADRRSGGRLATIGSAIAEPSRADILGALASGRAHTAGELASWVGLAPSTTSRHLGVLVDAGLIVVEPAGRHRYYRMASDEVAELLERIEAIDVPETYAPSRPNPGSELSFARSCYDHLAGELGVLLYASLLDGRFIEEMDGHPVLTTGGHRRLTGLGLDVDGVVAERRATARRCLDWSERRHHLGGGLGAALLGHMLSARWLERGRDSRVIRPTHLGREALADHFGISLQSN